MAAVNPESVVVGVSVLLALFSIVHAHVLRRRFRDEVRDTEDELTPARPLKRYAVGGRRV